MTLFLDRQIGLEYPYSILILYKIKKLLQNKIGGGIKIWKE